MSDQIPSYEEAQSCGQILGVAFLLVALALVSLGFLLARGCA